jgi:MFS family permease
VSQVITAEACTRNVRLLRFYVSVMMLTPFLAIWVIYLTDYRELSLTQVTIMEAFFWAVSMIAEIPAGVFADRFGRKPTFLVGVTLECLGVASFALASNFELLTGSYILWASGIAFGSGNAEAFLYETLVAGDRSGTYAKQQGRLQALMMASGMIGAACGAFVAAWLDLRAPILLGAGFYVVAFVLALQLDEPPRGEPGEAQPGYLQTLRESIGFLKGHPAVRFIIFFSVATGVASMTEWLLMQPFLDSHDVPIGLFGLIAIPVRLSSVFGSLGGARILEWVGIRRLVVLAFATTTAGLATLATVDHVAAFIGIMAIGLSGACLRPAVSTYVNERTSSSMRATVLSVAPFGQAASFALFFPFIGLASDQGIRLGFALLLGIVAAGAGISLALWLRADGGSPAPPLLQPEPVAT